jgi:hypothetical protein
MKQKPPTVAQLAAIIEAYNVARTNELRVVPLPFPPGYKNPLLDNLYDAACGAARALALLQVTEVSIAVEPRKV